MNTPNAAEITKSSVLTKDQKRVETRKFEEDGRKYELRVKLRFDDECGNGHNSFSITGDVYLCDDSGNPVRWDSGGCVHETIARVFPQFAHLIPWHLCSTDGPMHYVANTVFQAGDRDCWGGRKDEPRWVKYYVRPVPGPGLLVEWPSEKNRILGPKVQEFKTRDDAQRTAEDCGGSVVEWVTAYHEGKARELDAARRSAIWPDATDDELTADGLADRLAARLPALLVAFKAEMEKLGFVW
jgi:hypothetical protein